VRQALGATRREIVSLILRQGAALITTGIAVGILGAAAASRVLGALLFRVSPLDPVTYAAVVLLMAGVATLASIVPAVRASRVDPVKTIQAG
jgi:putative ABC transport system permease protein